jgi:serine/threonine-protein kinase
LSVSPGSGSSNARNPVEALADDFLRRQRGGERPTLEDYCRRHPDLADEIREVFPVLIRMEDLRSDELDDSTGGGDVAAVARLSRLGDYRILREVGRGGMGVVYEAEQESLGRRVALKVLPDAALSDAQQVHRFQREARAAARLHHTNIVPVFGVGRDDGHHYYVMQFIPGMGLDAVLDELRRLRRGAGSASPPAGRSRSNGPVSAAEVAEAILTGRLSLGDGLNGTPGPGTTMAATSSAPLVGHTAVAPKPSDSSVVSLPGASADSLARSDPDRTFFRSVARIGLQVAEALEYANRQGVLHRDVKPSNLLLDPKGNVWVADFGLAKAADTEDITHSGDIIGTVRYMAPERFAGRCDARSDVYALGLTLYELLALRPAFSAADRHELMRRVMSEEPERLRGLVPHLPRDLHTIVEKAIAREPSGRYASAAALAEDLQRFLDDKPIKARRISALEQAWRWAMRNRAVASLAVGLLLALVAGLAGVTWQWRKAVANLGVAEAANRKAQTRFGLAMEAVRAFTTGASEDVILKEKALERLRKKLLGQSQSFYDKLRTSLEGETDRASRSALAEALFDAGSLYGKVDAPTKAEQAFREALVLQQSLVREQPGEPAARRAVGRTRFALAELLGSPSLQQDSEARAELARAREVLEPLARERPDDGGARRLLADCESLDGFMAVRSRRTQEGRAALGRASALFEALIRDGPPYTLATTADGPTEYRRGLAEVLGRTVESWIIDGDVERAKGSWDRQFQVLEDLIAGPFADDGDWQKLASGLSVFAVNYASRENNEELARRCERAVEIFRRLAEANPTVASYKLGLAEVLVMASTHHLDMGHSGKARAYALSGLALLRTVPRQQHGAAESYCEMYAERALALIDLQVGQLGEALRHIDRSIAICEESVRAFPDSILLQERLLELPLSQAYIEATAGRLEDALRNVHRQLERTEAFLQDYPRRRLVRRDFIVGRLLESYILIQVGRLPAAAVAADRAATETDGLPTPLVPDELFCRGAAHILLFVSGRPAGPGRPAEPPGLRARADRAVADILESDRMGYRRPDVLAMVVRLLPDRPELRHLLMDQVFPNDPFRPDSGSDDDKPASDARGPRP